MSVLSILTLPPAGHIWGLEPSIALAASTCVSKSPDYFDGTQFNATSWGASASINTNTPTLCTGTMGTYSAAWSMSSGGASEDGWAQAGYILDRSHSSTYEFTQACAVYNSGTNQCYSGFHEWDGSAVSGTHTYWEEYDNTAHDMMMNIDGTTEDTTSFDPAYLWGQPFSNQFYGEVSNSGDNMPGTSSAPTYFNYMQYDPCKSSGCWAFLGSSTGAPTSDNPTLWDAAWVTTDQEMKIYSK